MDAFTKRSPANKRQFIVRVDDLLAGRITAEDIRREAARGT
jgi:hypothetical protein